MPISMMMSPRQIAMPAIVQNARRGAIDQFAAPRIAAPSPQYAPNAKME